MSRAAVAALSLVDTDRAAYWLALRVAEARERRLEASRTAEPGFVLCRCRNARAVWADGSVFLCPDHAADRVADGGRVTPIEAALIG